MSAEPNFNIAVSLSENAKSYPHKIATVLSNETSISFSQMESESVRMASFFQSKGICQGMRVAVFIRPGLDFVPSIFALFRLGAIPVFIDPGMKLKHALTCIQESQAKAMVGVSLSHVIRRVYPSYFQSIDIRILLAKSSLSSAFSGAHFLKSVCPRSNKSETSSTDGPNAVMLRKDSPAAIIFTSGSTGIPKGVEVTHGILNLQKKMLRDTYLIGQNEIDLVPFPLFALFSAAWGITSVIPNINPAKPSKANGLELAKLILKHQVTHTSGSPAIWKNLFDACHTNNITLPCIKRILMAGAPVSEKIIRSGQNILGPEARIFTPYGATEALPLTTISSEELTHTYFDLTRQGYGTCVGKPLNGIQIKAISIVDQAIDSIKDVQEMPQDQIGEIIVHGEVVTKMYINREQSTRMSKIKDLSGGFWHRMGDLGYVDRQGLLWFCGRKDHRILTDQQTFFPVQCEGIFNQHPNVMRSALVAKTENAYEHSPTLVVQTHGLYSKAQLTKELLLLAKSHELTKDIQNIVFKKHFPLDTRHNIKIDRIKLGRDL